MGPWQRARDAAAVQPGFLDLVDSRYHQNGLIPDRAVFADAFARWLDVRGYEPDSRGAPAAREALSRFYAGQGWRLPTDQFFLTAGTSEAYTLAFSDAGRCRRDEALLPRPGYPLFETAGRPQPADDPNFVQPALELGVEAFAPNRSKTSSRTGRGS